MRFLRQFSFWQYDENAFEKIPFSKRLTKFAAEYWLWIVLMLVLAAVAVRIYSNPADGYVLYLSADRPDRAAAAQLQEYLSCPVPDVNRDGLYVMKLKTVDPSNEEALKKLLDGDKKYLILCSESFAGRLFQDGYADAQYRPVSVADTIFEADGISVVANLPQEWQLLEGYRLVMPTVPDETLDADQNRAEQYAAAWAVYTCMESGGVAALEKDLVQPKFEK